MTKDQLKGIGTGIILATAILIPSVLASSEEVRSDEDISEDIGEAQSENDEVYHVMADEDWEDYQRIMEEMYEIEEALKAADEQNKLLKEKNEALDNELAKQKLEDESTEESVDISSLYLVVGQGMSAGEIGAILERAGMVRSSSSFREYIEDANLVMSIRPGEYVITEDMTIQMIAEAITN